MAEAFRVLAAGQLQMQLFMQQTLHAQMVGLNAADARIAELAKLMAVKEVNVSGASLLSMPAKNAYEVKTLESTKLVCEKMRSLLSGGAWGTLTEDMPCETSEDQRVFMAKVFELLAESSDSEHVSILTSLTLSYKAPSGFPSFSDLAKAAEAVSVHLIVSDRLSFVKEIHFSSPCFFFVGFAEDSCEVSTTGMAADVAATSSSRTGNSTGTDRFKTSPKSCSRSS